MSMKVNVSVPAMKKWRTREMMCLVQNLFCFGMWKKKRTTIATKGIAMNARYGFLTSILFMSVQDPICSEEGCGGDDDRQDVV